MAANKTITQLTKIPGLGAAKATELYKHGVRSKKDLRKPEIMQLLPAETKYNLQYNISRRIHSSVVKKLVSELPRELTLVGSGRRGTEYSRDIDFLTTSQLETITNKLNSLKNIEVLGQINSGSMRRSFIIKMDNRIFKIDVFATDRKNWAFALLHHTGSKNFNIRTRAQAKRMGYKLSQYGLFKDDKRLPGLNTERKILKKIGVTYKPPEERFE